MVKLIWVALLMSPNNAGAAQVTPAQEAELKRVMIEVVGIDKELEAIKAKRSTMVTSVSEKRAEYIYLVNRYPGVKISRDSSVDDMYKALYRYRMDLAHTVLPIANEQVRFARQESCRHLKAIEDVRARALAGDEYKRADPKAQAQTKATLDEIVSIAQAEAVEANEGDPCAPERK